MISFKNISELPFLTASTFVLIGCEENKVSSYEEQFEDEIVFTFPSSAPEKGFSEHARLVDGYMREKNIGYYSGGEGCGVSATSTKVRIDSSAETPEEIKKGLIATGLLPPDTIIESQ